MGLDYKNLRRHSHNNHFKVPRRPKLSLGIVRLGYYSLRAYKGDMS